VTVIGRRSRHFAGTRYLKRGASDRGYVANDVEVEQIVEDGSGHFSSFVQMRGSIPTFWAQEPSATVVRPDIQVKSRTPEFARARLHFEDMFERYGAPCQVLNLVKKKEKKDREKLIGTRFRECVERFHSRGLPRDVLIYEAIDVTNLLKQQGDQIALDRLFSSADLALRRTGFFCSAPRKLHRSYNNPANINNSSSSSSSSSSNTNNSDDNGGGGQRRDSTSSSSAVSGGSDGDVASSAALAVATAAGALEERRRTESITKGSSSSSSGGSSSNNWGDTPLPPGGGVGAGYTYAPHAVYKGSGSDLHPYLHSGGGGSSKGSAPPARVLEQDGRELPACVVIDMLLGEVALVLVLALVQLAAVLTTKIRWRSSGVLVLYEHTTLGPTTPVRIVLPTGTCCKRVACAPTAWTAWTVRTLRRR
jgi:hypothetical protein